MLRQGGSSDAELDKAVIIAPGLNDQMLLAGPTTGSWSTGTVGGFDLSALMLDTSDSATPSPTATLISGTGSFTNVPMTTALSPTRSPTVRLAPSLPTGTSPTTTSPASALPTSPSQELKSPSPTLVGQTTIGTPSPRLASPAPVVAASTSGSVFSSTNIGIVSAAATLAILVAGVLLRKKRNASNSAKVHRVELSAGMTPENGFVVQRRPGLPPSPEYTGGNTDPPPPPYTESTDPPAFAEEEVYGTHVQRTDPPAYEEDVYDTKPMTTDSRSLTRSTVGTDQLRGRTQELPAFANEATPVADNPPVDAWGDHSSPANGGGAYGIVSSASSGGDVGKAVVEAARTLAVQSQFPGVSEAATLVSILVNLVLDDKRHAAEMESRVKRCRIVIMMLERAAMVLGQVRMPGRFRGVFQMQSARFPGVSVFDEHIRLLRC